MRLLHRCIWLVIATLWLSGCGAQRVPLPLGGGGLPALSELDDLPRRASDITTVNGADAISSSGLPEVSVAGQVLKLDGTSAAGAIWAIWSIPLADGQTLQSLDANLPSNGFNRFWIAYADFSVGSWQFMDTAGNPLGLQNAAPHIEPADVGALLSPSRNIYIALVVIPTQKINVGHFDMNYSTGGGNNDPIADDFEDNDELEECHLFAGPGTYHASIHETQRNDMSDPFEAIDRYDFYCLDVPAGKQLTVTLRHEPQNHFNPAPDPSDYTDFDLWFYNDGETNENNFVESKSSFEVFYGFEQIVVSGVNGLCQLGIVPDIGDGYQDNAEYDLSVFFSDSTHSVSGKVTQNGTTTDKKFVVFLEPGNFNDVTWYDGEDPPGSRGDFVIDGVPDGTYTLKVQGSAGFYQTGWVYSTIRENVVVGGSNLSGQNINIEPYSGP